jgi:hypothetical protein
MIFFFRYYQSSRWRRKSDYRRRDLLKMFFFLSGLTRLNLNRGTTVIFFFFKYSHRGRDRDELILLRGRLAGKMMKTERKKTAWRQWDVHCQRKDIEPRAARHLHIYGLGRGALIDPIDIYMVYRRTKTSKISPRNKMDVRATTTMMTLMLIILFRDDCEAKSFKFIYIYIYIYIKFTCTYVCVYVCVYRKRPMRVVPSHTVTDWSAFHRHRR